MLPNIKNMLFGISIVFIFLCKKNKDYRTETLIFFKKKDVHSSRKIRKNIEINESSIEPYLIPKQFSPTGGIHR